MNFRKNHIKLSDMQSEVVKIKNSVGKTKNMLE